MTYNSQTSGPSQKNYADVIDAMRSVSNEDELWNLSEVLLKHVPEGTHGFSDICDAAMKEGLGGYSIHTLRLYRDTAKRWPANRRLKNVSYSAHREVMRSPSPSIDDWTKTLQDVYDNPDRASGGPNNVTVAAVRRAIANKSGRTAPVRAAGQGTTRKGSSVPSSGGPITNATTVLSDLKNGGSQLIAVIKPDIDQSDLRKVRDGLNKVLHHVDGIEAKAAQRAARKSPISPGPRHRETIVETPAPLPEGENEEDKKVKAPQGDLRGL